MHVPHLRLLCLWMNRHTNCGHISSRDSWHTHNKYIHTRNARDNWRAYSQCLYWFRHSIFVYVCHARARPNQRTSCNDWRSPHMDRMAIEQVTETASEHSESELLSRFIVLLHLAAWQIDWRKQKTHTTHVHFVRWKCEMTMTNQQSIDMDFWFAHLNLARIAYRASTSTRGTRHHIRHIQINWTEFITNLFFRLFGRF